MFYKRAYFIVLISILQIISSCKEQHAASVAQLVDKPAEMDAAVDQNIKAVLQYAVNNGGKINDSIKLNALPVVDMYYQQDEYKNVWSRNEEWDPLADSMYSFIAQAEYYGLFPSDYHYKELTDLKKQMQQDSLVRSDANVWTKADLMLTDAFMQIAKHLKRGRLQPDSLSSSDTTLAHDFFVKNLNTVFGGKALTPVLNSMEPVHKGYIELRNAVKQFVDSMDRRTYLYVTYPNRDSMAFTRDLTARLQQGGYMDSVNRSADSGVIAAAIKKFQKIKGIKADGKISSSLVKSLNTSDAERFKRIAITLDRYKQLPQRLPQKFIWVNLPGYYLQVWDNDTIVFESRVVVGKPSTRTPTLNSQITDMVTYPQWTIPASIIKKDIIPAMKRNPAYLARKGFSLVDSKGETVDPYSVNWQKYSKGIPYKIIQGSGDANALGVLKFNFNNPYSVYLHDTNERYLFKNAARALSHGCVRVQEWQRLAFYIARNDSLNQGSGTLSYNTDSIRHWLANKVRKRILVKNRIPLFIRYFTCAARNGRIVFYDDIYNEDKILREKYFANN